MSSSRASHECGFLQFVILPPILSFLLGLILGSYVLFFPGSTFLLLLAIGLGLLWREQLGQMTLNQGSSIFVCLVGGVVWWVAMVSNQATDNLIQWVNVSPVQVVGEVVDPVRRTPDRLVMIVEVSHIGQGEEIFPTTGLLRLTWREGHQVVRQGNYIEVLAQLREPYGTRNPGGFEYGEYLKRKGIHAVASVSGPGKVQVRASTNLWEFSWFLEEVDGWRNQVHQAAVDTLDDPALGLFLGMIIGEQSFITPEVREAFMATGTVHIISISGSHLGLIAFLVFFCVKGCVLRFPTVWLEWLSLRVTATRLSAMVTFPVVSFYSLLAGAEIATIRSWIMIALFLVAVWLGREKHLLSALGIAAILALVTNPQSIYDTSFQLSYSAVLAIALVIQMNRRSKKEDQELFMPSSTWGESLWERTKQAWWITLAVTLVTLPLVAYYFNQIAWLGLLSNVVVVPLVGFLMIPLGLLSVMWVLLTGSVTLPLAALNQAIADTLVHIVTWLAQIPGAVWHVASPSILMIFVFYGLLLTIVLCLHLPKFQMGCAIGVCVILFWWSWSPRFDIDANTVRVTFLDVGQGDATVLELPNGETILIDGGPAYRRLDMGKAVIGPYLWDRGIRRLDYVIATHPQWDHVGGLPWVLRSFDVGQYWSNGIVREQEFYQRLQQEIHTSGLKEHVASKGQEIASSGSCALKVLSPVREIGDRSETLKPSMSGEVLNNQSIITRLDCGHHSFLLTADAEVDALSKLNQLLDARSARVVKVPHHGAKSSLHRGWIQQLDAEVAVVSVGQHNRYGHPYPDVVEAYAQEEIPLYRTDLDGAVWITANLDSHEMTIHTALERKLQVVQLNTAVLKNEWENWGRLWRQWTGEVS